MWFIIADTLLSKLLILLYSIEPKTKAVESKSEKQNMLRWKGHFPKKLLCVIFYSVLIWEVHLSLRPFCAADRKFAQWLLPFSPPTLFISTGRFPTFILFSFPLPSLHTCLYSSHPFWYLFIDTIKNTVKKGGKVFYNIWGVLVQ